MYLDQPGLLKLWDRIKAVFAAKSHTHDASWAMAHSMEASKTLMTSSADMPLQRCHREA